MTRLLVLSLAALAAGLCVGPDPRPRDPRPAAPLAPAPLPPGCVARFGDARLRHDAPVTSLALSPDGKLLATATSADPVVRLWDVATARLLRELKADAEGDASVTLVGFAPDGRRLLVVRHQSPRVHAPHYRWHEPAAIDTATGAVTRWGWGDETAQRLPAFAVAPDGRAVAGVRGSDLKVWDFDTGVELRTLGQVAGAWDSSLAKTCYSPDGTQVVVSDEHPAVYVAPSDGSGPVRALPIPDLARAVVSVFWPEPGRVVALWYDGLAALDPASGRVIARRSHPGNMQVAPRVAAGARAYVKGDRDYHLHALDFATLEKVPGLFVSCGWRDGPIAASADGKTLAVGCGHAVRLFDAATGASRHPELDRHPADPVARLHLSADGTRLLSAGVHAAQTWDLPAGRRLATIDWGHTRSSPSWSLSPDGRTVAGAYDAAGRLLLHDSATGAVAARGLKPGEFGPHVSAEGWAGPDRVWVWDRDARAFTRVEAQGWRPGLAVADYEYPTFHAVSPDGRRLAASGHVALAVMTTDPLGPWVEVESYRDRPGPTCGLSPPPCAIPVRFSPDNRYLVTSYGSFALWDVSAKPRLVGILPHHETREWEWDDVTFSPDSRRVAAAVQDSDGKVSVHIWDAATAAELTRLDTPGGVSACAFLPGGRLLVAHLNTTFSVWDATLRMVR